MKKLFLLTLLCPLLLGVALANPTTNVVENELVETNNDLLVYANAEKGVENKVLGVKGAVVGDATLDHSETYYQLGTNPDNGHSIIRFATAVKGELKSLSYDLTYNGQTEVVNIENVYKGISDNGVVKYYGPNGLTTDEAEATHYFACFTLEFRSDAMVNTNFAAKLNVEAKDGTVSSTNVKQTTLGALKYSYEYVDDIVLDGKMDDAIYTAAVKSRGFVVRDDSYEKTVVYGTRTSKGVYLYFDYQANGDYSKGGAWYQGNNFELRFANKDGILMNQTEINLNAANKHQYWVSKYSHSTSHNASNAYLTNVVKNEATGKYEMKVELYVTYDFMHAKADDVIGFDYGSNPGQLSWRTFLNGNLDTIYLENSLKITTEGLFNGYIPENLCSEHTYGNYVTTTPASCANDGEETRACKWCDHKDSRVIESTGDHVWNMDAVTTLVPSTCSSHGVGSVPCNANCGHTKDDVELPLDPMNHSAWDDALGKCTGCGSSLKQEYTLDKSTSGGWQDFNNWFYAARNLSGDFKVVVNYSNYSNVANVANWGDYCWKTALTFIQDARPVQGNSAVWFCRMDWCAFPDWLDTKEDVGTYLNGDNDGYKSCWYPGNDALFKSAILHSDITLTVTRTGTDIRLDYVLVDQANGNQYTYWYRLANVSVNKPINVAFNAEYAKVVFKNVFITQ